MSTRILVLVGLTAMAGQAVVALRAQVPAGSAARLTFEVASVRPNRSGEFGGSFGSRPGGVLEVRNNTLHNMIRNAYQLQNSQIVGGPDWLENDRFDVTAKAPMQNPTREEFQAMVRALLADRFALKVHEETRELPIYALVLARADGRFGAKLTRSTTDCAAIADAARGGAPPPASNPNGRPVCGTRTLPGRILGGGIRMADLARNLSNFSGRIVVDRTGLTGAFDLELEYSPDRMPPAGTLPPDLPAPPVDAPSLFTAVQEQLGLKLDAQRAPVDVLVIDFVQRPLPD